VQQAWIQSMLRTKGWIVPNYNAPAGEDETQILRVVGASHHTRVMRLF
jgi:glutamate decarboxylase